MERIYNERGRSCGYLKKNIIYNKDNNIMGYISGRMILNYNGNCVAYMANDGVIYSAMNDTPVGSYDDPPGDPDGFRGRRRFFFPFFPFFFFSRFF